MMRRRRPLARAAMIGGAGYMAGKSMQRGSEREADQEARLQQLESQQSMAPQYAAAPPPPPAAAAPPPPAGGGDDLISKINQLKQLHDQGVLDDDEFNAAKQKLLAQ
ncbi:MAG: SHOCT domain-containing protein [Gaiellales bacterium]